MIGDAYRKLARQYHPDVNPGDPGDPEKRQTYEELRRQYQQTGARGGFDWS